MLWLHDLLSSFKIPTESNLWTQEKKKKYYEKTSIRKKIFLWIINTLAIKSSYSLLSFLLMTRLKSYGLDVRYVWRRLKIATLHYIRGKTEFEIYTLRTGYKYSCSMQSIHQLRESIMFSKLFMNNTKICYPRKALRQECPEIRILSECLVVQISTCIYKVKAVNRECKLSIENL